MTPDPAASPLRAPAPTLGQCVPAAAVTAVCAAAVLSLLYLLVAVGWQSAHADGPARPFPSLLAGTARLAVFLFVVVFAGALIRAHRPLQDRAFTLLGFLATFFGLAMLVVFFWQLGVEAHRYFTVTPVLIEQQNRALLEAVQQAEQTKATMLADLRVELETELGNAATDEEKAEIRALFETDIIPNRVKDLEITAAERRTAFEQGVREDTSPTALFWHFLTSGPSNQPQDAGVYPAVWGSLLVALITILVSVTVGVGAALYLEEYRANNWLGRIIQLNINNLAGVPSVVYGILGAAIFFVVFHVLEHRQTEALELLQADPAALTFGQRVLAWLPRIAARNVLGGGLTLGLLTLPVVIVASQEAIRAVPPSIRQGAYALGATQWQVIWRQVLPMSMPGILTGTILALSRAIGEAAPLILFGALLFVNQDPTLFSRFTILPMQIFGWADRPAVAVPGVGRVEIWQANAGLASVILLIALLSLNGVAIYLRNRYQKRVRG